MNRDVLELDLAAFGVSTSGWWIDSRGRSAGNGVTGAGQVVYGSQPRWVSKLQFVPGDKPIARMWRGLILSGRGRTNAFRVRMRDILSLGFDDLGVVVGPEGIPFDDDSFFSDDSGFDPSLACPVLAAAPAGATTLHVDGGYLAGKIGVGMIFSVADWPYAVRGITGAGADTVLSFEMPLREAVPEGAEIDFDATGLFTLEGDLEGLLNLDVAGFGAPSLSLIEWLGPDRP